MYEHPQYIAIPYDWIIYLVIFLVGMAVGKAINRKKEN